MLQRLQIATLLLLAAGSAFGQTHQPTPGKLSNIFRGPLSTRVASGDTLAVSITPNGVVPIYSTSTTIQPGSWVSIYGNNLATGPVNWNNDFPTNLANTTVTINGKKAYLYFLDPTQINLQAPDDTATGTVPVVVTTPAGTATSTVTLGQFGPSFFVFLSPSNQRYVAGIILRNDGSGSQGGGTYDIIGPAGNSLGIPTVPVKSGDIVELYAVGFGPTSPVIPSGMALQPGQFGTATTPVTILINGVAVTPSFVGITEAGLFQINLTIPPAVGTGDLTLTALVGGMQTPNGVLISAQ